MTDRISIPQVDANEPGAFNHPGPIGKPAWVRTVDGKLGGVRCGQCGRWGASKGGHTVDSAGDVNPSWLHEPTGMPCGWHVWLHLEGWPG
mgnify:CR=1 FL=1